MLFFLSARCSHCLGLKLTHNTAMLKQSRELVPFSFLSTFAGWLLLYLKLYKPTNTSNGITVPKYSDSTRPAPCTKCLLAMGKQRVA